jgi:hypothetical protein
MFPTLSVKSNVAELARNLQLERQDIPKRTATALTRTALEIRKGLKSEMERVFDRPTRHALNAFFVQPATASAAGGSGFVSAAGSGGNRVQAQYLKAVVWLKAQSVLSDYHYLEPQIYGGARRLKPFEERLRRAGLLPEGMAVVPGERAQLDRYGNVSRGQLVRILSQLRTFTEGGYDAHPTRSKRSRRNRRRAGEYFVGRPGNGAGPLGVWQRVGKGARPVLIFVRQPHYSARLKFFDVAERIAAREFPIQFARAAAEAAARRQSRLAA